MTRLHMSHFGSVLYVQPGHGLLIVSEGLHRNIDYNLQALRYFASLLRHFHQDKSRSMYSTLKRLARPGKVLCI